MTQSTPWTLLLLYKKKKYCQFYKLLLELCCIYFQLRIIYKITQYNQNLYTAHALQSCILVPKLSILPKEKKVGGVSN